MPPADTKSGEFVTHGEFSQFRDYVGQQFAAIQRDSESKHGETMSALSALRRDTQPKPTNWPGIIGMGVGVIGLVVGFLSMRIQPVESDLDRLDANQRQMRGMIDEAGRDRFTGSDGDELRDGITELRTIIKLNGLDVPFPERSP